MMMVLQSSNGPRPKPVLAAAEKRLENETMKRKRLKPANSVSTFTTCDRVLRKGTEICLRTGLLVCGCVEGRPRAHIFWHPTCPPDPAARDDLLLGIMGSPDARQIDGIGGGDPLTSKVAVLSPPSREDADVDYLFLQVFVDQPLVSDKQGCRQYTGRRRSGGDRARSCVSYRRAHGRQDTHGQTVARLQLPVSKRPAAGSIMQAIWRLPVCRAIMPPSRFCSGTPKGPCAAHFCPPATPPTRSRAFRQR